MNAVFVVLLASWCSGLTIRDLPIRLHGLGTTCDDLPPFERLAPLVGDSRRVAFVTERPPDGARHLFCAQHDLAPVPLERWFMPDIELAGRDLAATAVIVHLDDPTALEARVDELTTAATAQALRVEVVRLSAELAVVRLGGSA